MGLGANEASPCASPADLNVATAMAAMFSLFLMLMGAVCITMSLSKEILFFLKPASVCFILSGEGRQARPAGARMLMASWCPPPGLLVLLSLLLFHQSVLALLASEPTVPLSHRLSWSASCVGCAGAVLIVGGILFLLLALPPGPWRRRLPASS